jgi:hypothetical protein
MYAGDHGGRCMLVIMVVVVVVSDDSGAQKISPIVRKESNAKPCM